MSVRDVDQVEPASPKGATVAVVVPSKDRPHLVDEAIVSALRQTHAPNEIIVVDDGSAVPVDAAALRQRHGNKVRVLRNTTNRGLAYSRNLGVEAGTSEFVIHLDDDDLLAPNAIEACLQAWYRVPGVELVMFGVEGFGPRAGHFNTVQPQGVDKVIRLARGVDAAPGVVAFDRQLLPALLQTVPSAFQRVMTRTDVWHRVSALRRHVYKLDPAVPDDEAAKWRITGPLRDSEWALYAAAVCNRTCLVRKPLYLARCEGQGGSSQPAMRAAHTAQSAAIKTALLAGAGAIDELRPFRGAIRESLARVHFDAAYRSTDLAQYRTAWDHWMASVRLQPQWRHLKLLARIGLDRLAPGAHRRGT
jgi:hypothetical protein